MAFTGPAPETVNGRIAMLGFVAAAGAELSGSGVSSLACACRPPSHVASRRLLRTSARAAFHARRTRVLYVGCAAARAGPTALGPTARALVTVVAADAM
jgi:hypothetical protein